MLDLKWRLNKDLCDNNVSRRRPRRRGARNMYVWSGVKLYDARDRLYRDTPITIRRPLAPDQALNDKQLILLDIT